jgi:hypothetical protein
MMHEHFRQALVDGDVGLVRKIWAHVFPNWPQPKTDEETLVTLHVARTAMDSIEFRHRAYSHCWLTERSIPSQLPDPLKPRAERLYPRVVDGVGIAIAGNLQGHVRARHVFIRSGMEDVVKDIYATDKAVDPAKVKIGIMDARHKLRKA